MASLEPQELGELLHDPNADDTEEASTEDDSDDEEPDAKRSEHKRPKKENKSSRICKKWIHAGIFRDPRGNTHQIWYGFAFYYNTEKEKDCWNICYAADKHGQSLGNRGAGRGKRYMTTFNGYLQAAWKEFLDADGAFAHGKVTIGATVQRQSLFEKWHNPNFVDRYPDGNDSLMIGPDINVIRPPDRKDDNQIPTRPAEQHANCYPNTRIPLSTRKIKIGLYVKWNMNALTVIEDFLMGRMAVTANANVPGYEVLQVDRIESAFFHLGFRADWHAIRKANKHVRQKDVKFAINSRSWTEYPPIQVDKHQRGSDRVELLMSRLRDRNPETHERPEGEDSSDDEDDFLADAHGGRPQPRPELDSGAGNDLNSDNEHDNDAHPISSRTWKRSRSNKSKGKKQFKRKGEGKKSGKKEKKPKPKSTKKKKDVSGSKKSQIYVIESSDDEDENLQIIDEFATEEDDRPGILAESDADEWNGLAGKMLAAMNQRQRPRLTPPRIPLARQAEEIVEESEMDNIDESFADDEDNSDDNLFVSDDRPKPRRGVNLSGIKDSYLKFQSSKSPSARGLQAAFGTPEIAKAKTAMRTLLSNHGSAQSSQAGQEAGAEQHTPLSTVLSRLSKSARVHDEDYVVMTTSESDKEYVVITTSESDKDSSGAALSSSGSPPTQNLLDLVRQSQEGVASTKTNMTAGSDDGMVQSTTSPLSQSMSDSDSAMSLSTADTQRKRRSQEISEEIGSPSKKIKKEGLAFLIKSEMGVTIDLCDSDDEEDKSSSIRGKVVSYSSGDPWQLDGAGNDNDPYIIE